MYIERVQIKDLRCFADATIEFVQPDANAGGALGNVTILLGDNGVGKTTVLRAIALGALHRALVQAGYVPYSMVRRAPDRSCASGLVEAQLIGHPHDFGHGLTSPGSEKFSAVILLEPKGDVEQFTPPVVKALPIDMLEKLDQQLYSDDSPGILVLGYGATRRADPASEFSPGRRRKLRLLRYERVSSLFEEQVSLVPLAGWLPKLAHEKPQLHGRVCELLNQLIPPETRFTGELDGDDYLFERGGVKVTFAALSDGYRGYIGLLGDLFYHLCTGLHNEDEPTESRGIVLIDEIGLHLHPSWQRVVVPTLATILPKLQFVLTTHSPIIAGTVYANNIRLLEANDHGLSQLVPLDEEIHGLNADQVLLTGAFGLRSSRAPDFVERYEQLRRGLDPDDWKDALQLMRMANRGSAGEEQPEFPAPPVWATEAAQKLAGVLAAEDRPAKPAAPKQTSTKKPSAKKSRS